MLDRLEHFLLVLLPQYLQLLHVDECPPPPPGRLRISLRDGGQIKAVRSLSVAENISWRTRIVLSEITAQPLIFQCLKWLEGSCVRGSMLEGNEGVLTSRDLPP